MESSPRPPKAQSESRGDVSQTAEGAATPPHNLDESVRRGNRMTGYNETVT